MRFAHLLVPIAVLVAALVAGCGSSGSDEDATTESARAEANQSPSAPAGASAQSCLNGAADIAELRVTRAGCDTGRAVVAAWTHDGTCAAPASASRFACTIRGWRCLGTATERGIAVDCARPGRSIAFVARR
jgi:hypothetical protein